MRIECNYSAIIQEKNYSDSIDALSETYPRFNEVQDDIEWALGKNALLGISCEDDLSHRIYKTNPVESIPIFWVLYRFDASEKKVYLLSIIPAITENQK